MTAPSNDDVSAHGPRGSRARSTRDDGEVPMTSPGRETMLVVDDEEMVRRLAARILRGEGYHVLEAAGGEEAIRVLQRASQRINLVVTDVAMPGVGGRQLGETIFRC